MALGLLAAANTFSLTPLLGGNGHPGQSLVNGQLLGACGG